VAITATESFLKYFFIMSLPFQLLSQIFSVILGYAAFAEKLHLHREISFDFKSGIIVIS